MTNIQTKNDEQGRIIISSWEEVPQFQNETEEQAWWDKHTQARTTPRAVYICFSRGR